MPIANATATLDVALSTYRFVDRRACPVCIARTSQPLYVCGMAEEPLRTYLNSYYGTQRAQELDGHGYTLVKCTAFQLVYQLFIDDSVFLKRLYDQWLNAPAAASEADRAASGKRIAGRVPRSTRSRRSNTSTASRPRPCAALRPNSVSTSNDRRSCRSSRTSRTSAAGRLPIPLTC